MEAALEGPPRNKKRMDLSSKRKDDVDDSGEDENSIYRGAGGPILPMFPGRYAVGPVKA